MTLDAHLPVLQVVVPLLIAPLVIMLRPSGLAWAAATATSFMAFMIAAALPVFVARHLLGGSA